MLGVVLQGPPIGSGVVAKAGGETLENLQAEKHVDSVEREKGNFQMNGLWLPSHMFGGVLYMW